LIPFNDPRWSSVEPHISYTDYFNLEKIEYQDAFIQLLKPYLDNFRDNCLYKFTTIDGFWCQKYKARDYHVPHTHGPVGYSCVFYAKLSNEHKSTFFFSPFMDEFGCNKSSGMNVKEGDLVFFPSNLLHMAPPHDSEEERIIISFNLV